MDFFSCCQLFFLQGSSIFCQLYYRRKFSKQSFSHHCISLQRNASTAEFVSVVQLLKSTEALPEKKLATVGFVHYRTQHIVTRKPGESSKSFVTYIHHHCHSLVNFPSCSMKWCKLASAFAGDEEKIKQHPAGCNQHFRNRFLVFSRNIHLAWSPENISYANLMCMTWMGVVQLPNGFCPLLLSSPNAADHMQLLFQRMLGGKTPRFTSSKVYSRERWQCTLAAGQAILFSPAAMTTKADGMLGRNGHS